MLSLSSLYELVETLGRRGQAAGLIVGGVVGGLVGAWLAWIVCKHWLPNVWSEKVKIFQEQLGDLGDQRQALEGQLDDITKDHEILGRLNAQYEIQIEAGKLTVDRASKERDTLQAEVATSRETQRTLGAKLVEGDQRYTRLLDELKGLKENARKGWTDPPDALAVSFLPLHTRRTPIISVVNLKGGVGKTTITANLGITLAREHGLRVLMADLDYQGSLTSLCLSPQEMEDTLKSRRFIEDVFRANTVDRYRSMMKCVTRLEEEGVGPAYLLATEDSLDTVESEEMAPWLLRISHDDIRFRLREALHVKQIQDDFDIILLDCPPRLSTASVNALAASDYVLIPVLLEPVSAEAIPRLLNWIKKFKASFCPDLAVMGVVANRFNPWGGKPVALQQALWHQLKEQCRGVWGDELRFFDEAMIPRFHGLSHKHAALSGGSHEAVMKDLAAVILKELPPYARRRTPAIHPVPHPSASGIRS